MIACSGTLDNVQLLSLQIIKEALREQSFGKDLILNVPIRYGLGFGLQSKELPIGPSKQILYWD